MNRQLFTRIAPLYFLALTTSVAVAQHNPSIPSANDAKKPPEVLKIGSPAAQISIEHWISDADGKFAPVTDLKKGKVYVIEFWATWCVPCIGCMPHLAEIQTKYNANNVQVISISDEPLEKVTTFLERDYSPKTKRASKEHSGTTPKTYAELTSVYCLTTDPDRSVYNSYHRASGRRGIPSAYIVGKTGLIEWMGHPNSMDKALKSVVSDSWDRVAFAKAYQAEQKRDLMLSRVSAVLKKAPPKESLKVIDLALNQFADDAVAMSKLNSMKSYIVTTPLYDSVDSGDNIKALALIKEVAPILSSKAQRQMLSLQSQLQLKESQFDEAEKTLLSIANDDSFPAVELTRIARDIYTQSKGNKTFPKSLFTHGIVLSQKAVDMDDNNSFFISTLARMQHSAGDLDAAIKTQTRAVAHSDGRNKGYQWVLDQFQAEKSAGEKSK